jgi:hypothetical protein
VTRGNRVGGRRNITTPQITHSTMKRTFKALIFLSRRKDIFVEDVSILDKVVSTVEQ